MVFGMAAVILFGVVDTFYVGRLGARELAAMSFTFPVTFVVMSVTFGMGVGVTSAISRAVGADDRRRVRRLATDGLALAVVLTGAVAGAGLLTIGPVFSALGAEPDMIALIRRYMVPWYLGVGLFVIPVLGNSAIRATGDTKTPSLVMIIAGGVNIVLDPLFIFGIGPFPRWELMGAAVATLLSWGITFAAALWILARREHMLDVSRPRVADVIASWTDILHVGLPSIGTNVLVPLAGGVLTRMVTAYGTEAVAGFGVATRVEALSMIGVIALATALSPFTGQNFGAGNIPRLREAHGVAIRMSLVYGAAVAVLLALTARPVAALFNEDPVVRETVVRYLRLVPISYAAYGIVVLSSAMFNAVRRPLGSATLIGIRLFGLGIPLAYVGSRVFGVVGIFGGIFVANVLVGALAIVAVRRFIKSQEALVGESA